MKAPNIPVMLEHEPCPMGCPPSDHLVLIGRDRLHNLPGEYRVVRCTRCQLLRTDPRPTAETIGYYYPSDYAPYHVAASIQTAKKPPSLSRRLKQRFNRALGLEDSKALPIMPPGRMLEIGCASGSYLIEAIAKGWQASGIELSSESVTRAQQLGLDVTNTTVENMPTPNIPFDLIVGWMVFEHVHNPVATFSRIREWVRPEGWLAFSIPDAGATGFKIFGARGYDLHLPCHLTHFSVDTATQVLAKSGWKITRVIWHQNPNAILQSLRYLALDSGHNRIAAYLADMVAGKRGRKLHRFLARWLAVSRQSGRMTIWAQRVD